VYAVKKKTKNYDLINYKNLKINIRKLTSTHTFILVVGFGAYFLAFPGKFLNGNPYYQIIDQT